MKMQTFPVGAFSLSLAQRAGEMETERFFFFEYAIIGSEPKASTASALSDRADSPLPQTVGSHESVNDAGKQHKPRRCSRVSP